MDPTASTQRGNTHSAAVVRMPMHSRARVVDPTQTFLARTEHDGAFLEGTTSMNFIKQKMFSRRLMCVEFPQIYIPFNAQLLIYL